MRYARLPPVSNKTQSHTAHPLGARTSYAHSMILLVRSVALCVAGVGQFSCGCSALFLWLLTQNCGRKREEPADFLPGRRHGALESAAAAAAPRVLVVATDVALAWLQRMQQRSVSPAI